MSDVSTPKQRTSSGICSKRTTQGGDECRKRDPPISALVSNPSMSIFMIPTLWRSATAPRESNVPTCTLRSQCVSGTIWPFPMLPDVPRSAGDHPQRSGVVRQGHSGQFD